MTNTTPASPTPESLVFAAYHRPSLTSGDYEIQLEHTLQTQNVPTNSRAYISPQTFTARRSFRVEGEQFQLKPEDIQAVFPPQGSLGDHSNVLPHIILTRSTFPWERSPDGSTEPLTWLLLLVFSEQEKPETKVITLGELGTQGAKFPAIALNDHQKARDPVSVIDVPRRVLEPLLPSRNELAILAHVRRINLSGESISRTDLDDSEQGVIIANRLPQPGATSTVHLVSIEGRYTAGGGFDFQNASPNDSIRLVSLTSWRFACVTSTQTFANMIKGLERDHRSFRLPPSPNSDAESFLQEGFVPVRHALRQGGNTLSWYRGPFVTGQINDSVEVPVHTTDALLRYHTSVGMFDVSYSSAWELGRLMALQSPTFSTNLYEWKRRRDQQAKCNERPEQQAHPYERATTDTEMPEAVKTWLNQLSHLQGVPFKYLVPDEKLLPKESIRFLRIDPNWIRCLLDGAYSIGRVTPGDFVCDCATSLSIPYGHATGVLIRSDLISGYPGLLIDAYDSQGSSLTELRRQYLSPNILLCLFDGNLSRLDIHQKPEMLHFALEMLDDNRYQKILPRQNNQLTITGELREGRVVAIADLSMQLCTALQMELKTFNSGHFALQMLETSERVSMTS
ncbi:hypothetical protein [Cylindrospermum sp. FACHB-282]|uniref:hypothetical protein n=1 Tax=Cylindrospermum sp. FACHB-282 TaxID=2692794 RepID=UPI0016892DD8|nr:hypothetical protein [Cylindrospermum sp. FACHB-282]MBD2385024.1 hypothetical protein [Cylindrospermum sp. FACHB-282]